MFTIDVQFHDYVRPIRSSATNATALNQRLHNQAPPDIKPDEREALAAVDAAAEEVRLVQAERDKLAPAQLRPVLTPFVSDWSALYGALLAKARVSPLVSDVGARAGVVAGSLFPDGVAFVQLPARGAWSEAFRRLERIDNEKMKKEIDELVGKEFLVGVERTTQALADALGMGEEPKVGSSSAALQDALNAFGRSVGAYGRVLAAHCDDSDPVSVERFLKAVKPMDEHRAAVGHGSAANDTTTTQPAAPTTQAPSTSTTPSTTGHVAAATPSTAAHAAAPATPSTAASVAASTQSSVGVVAAPTQTSAGNVAAPAQSSVGTIASPVAPAANTPPSNGASNAA